MTLQVNPTGLADAIGGGGNFMDMLSMTSPQGAAVKMGADVVGALLGKTTSSSATSDGRLDGSNWNVNFGAGGITSSAQKSETAKADATNWITIGAAVVALAIVVRAWRKG
jgi:hypothetical protein